MSRVLFADLGTTGGWAVWDDGAPVASGVRVYGHKDAHRGMRPSEAGHHYQHLIATYKPDVVAFEMVRRHAGTDAAHVYGALLGALESAAFRGGQLPMHPCEVGALKVRAGVKRPKGKMSKHERRKELKRRMVEACRSMLGLEPVDDNDAEANFGAVCTGEKLFGWVVPDLQWSLT